MAEKLYVKAEQPADTPVKTVPYVAMGRADLIKTMLIGAAVGAVSTGIYYLLNKYIFSAALCRPGLEGCENAPLYATTITTVVSVIAGVVLLAKIGIYRPLLVAAAASLALWNIYIAMNLINWYWAIVVAAILWALAYGVFAWIARLRSFVVSAVLLAAGALLVRVVLG